MSRGGIHTFVLIFHFLNDKQCHITIRFSELKDMFGNAMAIKMNDVLTKHGLNTHVFAYVKDDGSNLATMTFALTFVVSCEVLGLSTPFIGSY
jgi:hypothetical protein